MTSPEIRQRFLDFFAKRGHAILPSASLVPKNDPSVLFNTAGMQPLVPYLLGEPHPLGKRLASCQKCVRTGDIDEVGDATHLTFFEMLGNWSLGDYFKSDAIKWSYELLTSKEEGFGLDPSRLYITLFEGNKNAPRDEEAFGVWKKYIPEHRFYFLGWNGKKEPNWWDAGDNGPAGPDTEIFYDVTGKLGDLTKDEYLRADEEQKVVEIWNNVFMEYLKSDGMVVGKLKNKNVDTGSGFERLVMTLQGKSNVYDTDLFEPIIIKIKKETGVNYNERSARIIADHIKSAAMIIADGVSPSNKDQGYIVRRLIRRAMIQARAIGIRNFDGLFTELLNIIFEIYKDTNYFLSKSEPIHEKEGNCIGAIGAEVDKFTKTLESGLKEFEKGIDPFILATTYGFPIELTEELAKEKGISIDRKAFDAKMKAHQELSRAGAEQKFKGGLANTGEMTTKLHTAHHLLLAALQQVVDINIHQKGSNITDERLRIDFNFDRKLTDEEKKQVEDLVNEWIKTDYAVVRKEMPREEAEKLGAEMEFGTKYPEMVSVYVIEDKSGNPISKEFCGGPHVTHTGVLGTFSITKEEASSSGVRRIKAILR